MEKSKWSKRFSIYYSVKTNREKLKLLDYPDPHKYPL